LQRIAAVEPEQGERGVLELFREAVPEQPDEDAPLSREPDDDAA
jgi:hypothetical protein